MVTSMRTSFRYRGDQHDEEAPALPMPDHLVALLFVWQRLRHESRSSHVSQPKEDASTFEVFTTHTHTPHGVYTTGYACLVLQAKNRHNAVPSCFLLHSSVERGVEQEHDTLWAHAVTNHLYSTWQVDPYPAANRCPVWHRLSHKVGDVLSIVLGQVASSHVHCRGRHLRLHLPGTRVRGTKQSAVCAHIPLACRVPRSGRWPCSS